jgi:hypothetical protein
LRTFAAILPGKVCNALGGEPVLISLYGASSPRTARPWRATDRRTTSIASRRMTVLQNAP